MILVNSFQQSKGDVSHPIKYLYSWSTMSVFSPVPTQTSTSIKAIEMKCFQISFFFFACNIKVKKAESDSYIL